VNPKRLSSVAVSLALVFGLNSTTDLVPNVLTKPPGYPLAEEYTGCEPELVELDEVMWLVCVIKMGW
jgi:hypothetical protein